MVEAVCLPGCGIRTMLSLFDGWSRAFSTLPLVPSFSSALHTCAHSTASKMMSTLVLLGTICFSPHGEVRAM